MACDICGATGVQLTALRPQYQFQGMSDICSNCVRRADKELWRLRSILRRQEELAMHRYLKDQRESFKEKQK